MPEALVHCSFCDKHKDRVGKLIVSHTVAICNECVDLCGNLLKDGKTVKQSSPNTVTIPDPKDITDYLDQYVIGQSQAKIVLGVAVVNHYKRIKRSDTEVQKANILMLGPTGTGKTLLARTVARYLDVPFVVADATCLTEAGYAGDDVESMITRLYTAADGDIERCQRGIVFLDEIEQVAERLGGHWIPGKLIARLVGLGPKKGFQKLHNILLFHAVFGFNGIADTKFVDGVAINPRIGFDVFYEPLFVLCDF